MGNQTIKIILTVIIASAVAIGASAYYGSITVHEGGIVNFLGGDLELLGGPTTNQGIKGLNYFYDSTNNNFAASELVLGSGPSTLSGQKVLNYCYDSTNNNWQACLNISGINDLTDVTITSLHSGDMLYYSGAAWVNLATGTADQVLIIGSTGYPEWGTLSTVAGSDTQVQFNSGGVFAGNANFTFASSTGVLTVTYASTTGVTATNFWGNLTGDVTGKLTGNASSTMITVSQMIWGNITGTVTGNADTATALAANPAACATGQFVNDIAANGTLTCAIPPAAAGASKWATTTNNMVIYPSSGEIVVIGGSATTTTGYKLEVIGNAKIETKLTTSYASTTGLTATDLWGNVTGKLTGNASSTMISASQMIWGNLTGNVTGDVTGDVTGTASGNLTSASLATLSQLNTLLLGESVASTTANLSVFTNDSGFITASTTNLTASGMIWGNLTGNVTGKLTGNASSTMVSVSQDLWVKDIPVTGLRCSQYPAASSTLVYMGAYGSAGTTTLTFYNPFSQNITVAYVGCKLDGGTSAITRFGDGTNWMTQRPCSTTYATTSVSSNNVFTPGEAIKVEYGTQAGGPTSVIPSMCFYVNP
jgi:hypothetical protein